MDVDRLRHLFDGDYHVAVRESPTWDRGRWTVTNKYTGDGAAEARRMGADWESIDLREMAVLLADAIDLISAGDIDPAAMAILNRFTSLAPHMEAVPA